MQVIRERHAAVDMLMRSPDSMKAVRDILTKIKDVPKILQRLRLSQGAAAKDFGLLTASLANLLLLKHAMLSSGFVHAGDGLSSLRDGCSAAASLASHPQSLMPGADSSGMGYQPPGIVRKAFACIDDVLQTCTPAHALDHCCLQPSLSWGSSSYWNAGCRDMLYDNI